MFELLTNGMINVFISAGIVGCSWSVRTMFNKYLASLTEQERVLPWGAIIAPAIVFLINVVAVSCILAVL